MRAKVDQYLAAGTRLVWGLRSRERTVTVHRPDAPPIERGVTDTLDDGDVLPGFSVQVSALFDIQS